MMKVLHELINKISAINAMKKPAMALSGVVLLFRLFDKSHEYNMMREQAVAFYAIIVFIYLYWFIFYRAEK